MQKDVWIGVDVGSISVKLAVYVERGADSNAFATRGSDGFPLRKVKGPLSDGAALFVSEYVRHQGAPTKAAEQLVARVLSRMREHVAGVSVTGSGARRLADRNGWRRIHPFRAAAEGIACLHEDVRTVFEMGGEKARYLHLSDGSEGSVRILDYESSGECAAGTGSFFDQQVGRLKVRIEDVGDMVSSAERAASIAGRCSVFAKSDMIHAQQRGYQPDEVLKGLCHAVVRNFKGSISKGKVVEPVVAFIGGMAMNRGVADAVREQFDLPDGRLLVPEHPAFTGAVGAAVAGWKEGPESSASLKNVRIVEEENYPTTMPLSMERVRILRDSPPETREPDEEGVDVFLGIDIGSVSTNLALIDGDGRLIHGIYRMTEGRPVEVVKRALLDMERAVGDGASVRGVGTTGSGRELIGLLVGADTIKDEITAHRTGAIHVSRECLDREVDTIFEIGGQDSKFISLRDGVVVDFGLNEACAAGTGSFLEEQAQQLGIRIKEEFAEMALASKRPLKLGERCTVFMEKELVPYLHRGIPARDIAAGLSYAVVHNYLNRVVKKRKIGDVVFFQGGTAYNDAVAAAFSTVLDQEIIVPPHNGIMGAIGAALLARSRMGNEEASSFRGWSLEDVAWDLREFTCRGCSNACIVQEFTVEGERSYWGDKCSDRYRKRAKSSRTPVAPDLIRMRGEAIGMEAPGEFGDVETDRPSVGIPRALVFYDRFPFWRTYFETLGFRPILSKPSRKDVIEAGVEASVAEPCFPVQAAHGHILDLLRADVDWIFVPHVENEEDPWNSAASFICPWTQTLPLVAKHTPALEGIRERLLMTNLQFRLGRKYVEKSLLGCMRGLGVSARRNHGAVEAAYEAQAAFRDRVSEAGREALETVRRRGRDSIVLLGRPYNLYDPGLNLNLPTKLRTQYGVDVIPMDLLPLDGVDIRNVHDHMFWNYGRKILQAARFCRDRAHLHVVYLSNFKCGPDSYIRHYVEDALGEPFLFLQLDSHANDAGVMTRVEAFLESKNMV